ncbi:DeoR/GlpR family DNA-binding transcription regulator [Staphylococcus durrellii]|uniref:DeoR/GlpR family DNA-binding transcription regulator n=1 Tax=Staphylococcus durrellii TaxID=2781773 RepID=UPI00189FBE79|nr:DeoR/GlpR family DNA-binding transcription regulator [Staphylococcus durrellii]MBF7017681.1 DeoR/GlpR transcriptional regulator [Staphylococcus durrellii]
MITEKRHELILNELAKKDFLSLQELIDNIGCSASTIRRDLSKLQQLGKLTRLHGGATLNQSVVIEPNLIDKRSQNLQEKKEIAQVASGLIEDNDCVFLDAGSSTLEMIPFITSNQVTVVTNGLTHVEELIKNGIKTITIGGQVKSNTFATVGPSAIETLGRYRFDKAFIGINGIDVKYGLTTPDDQEAFVKKYALKQALNKFVVADTSKFNKVFFTNVSIDQDVSIISSEQVEQVENYELFNQQYNVIGGKR